MIKTDPIIAVKDIVHSSQWYQQLLECTSIHGGDEFDVLVDGEGQVVLCLHKWQEHEHPTMSDPSASPGNGLILYFRTSSMEQVRANLESMGGQVEDEVSVNPNSHHREFTLRDPDGYYLIISEYHDYGI